MLVLVPEYTYLDIYTSTYISERCTSADKSYKLSTHILGGGRAGRGEGGKTQNNSPV